MNADNATLQQLNEEAAQIVMRYDEKSAAVLPLLRLAHDKLGVLTCEAEAWVGDWTQVPIVHVHETASFYTMLKHPSKKNIRFCTGLSCVLAGGQKMREHLEKRLKETGSHWELEESECLCACEKAPMMQVDGKNIDNLTEHKIDEIIKKL